MNVWVCQFSHDPDRLIKGGNRTIAWGLAEVLAAGQNRASSHDHRGPRNQRRRCTHRRSATPEPAPKRQHNHPLWVIAFKSNYRSLASLGFKL